MDYDAAAATLNTHLWLRNATKMGWVLHSNLSAITKYCLPDLDVAERRKVIKIIMRQGHFLSYRPIPTTHPHYLYIPEPITDPEVRTRALQYWRWSLNWRKGWRPDWDAVARDP